MRSAAIALLWLLCACNDVTEVRVMITADSTLAARTDAVRVEVRDTSGAVVRESELAVTGRDIGPDGNPVELPLFPEGAGERSYTVTAELLEQIDGEENRLGIQTLRGTYANGQRRQVWMTFDAECELARCPDGYRCQEGACVEHCVEPVPVALSEDALPRTPPAACDAPCTASGCSNDEIVDCDAAGFRILERQCGVGCSDDESTCKRVAPSNVGELELVTGLEPLVVGEDGGVLFADNDTALFFQGSDLASGQVICMVCETCDACEGAAAVIDFASIDGGLGCDGEEQSYNVFFLERLHVVPGATLHVAGDGPIVVWVNDDVIVEGTISASADASPFLGPVPGPGGFQGGLPGVDGSGPGAGRFAAGAGGGGASYGGFGGDGGRPGIAEAGGGAAGIPYPEDEVDLIPLCGGSGGGGGNGFGFGGPGGGAMQIVTNGRVQLGPDGMIVAAGRRAFGSEFFGGGAGSGGAILLEAGELVCEPGEDSDVIARIGAPGGGGGGGGLIFAVDGASDGDLQNIPARGGEPLGGDGSKADGDANPGRGGTDIAGGGGGGAGRVRINTLEMTADSYQAECGLLLQPTSFGTVLVEQD